MSWLCRKWFCLLSTVILRFVFQKQQWVDASIFFFLLVDKFRCKCDRHEKFDCDKKQSLFASFKSTAFSDQKRSSLTKDHAWWRLSMAFFFRCWWSYGRRFLSWKILLLWIFIKWISKGAKSSKINIRRQKLQVKSFLITHWSVQKLNQILFVF